MATPQDIKGFIARWLQLGKGVETSQGAMRYFKPDRVLGYQGFSQEFEAWWQEFEAHPHDWVLSGTDYPLSVLYHESWEITDCARCEMPIPMQVAGVNDVDCPCHDLPHWPNLELPHPHTPKETNDRLEQIRDRLRSK